MKWWENASLEAPDDDATNSGLVTRRGGSGEVNSEVITLLE